MGSSDIVPLGLLLLIIVLSALVSMARSSLAVANLREAAEQAEQGHLAAQLVVHLSRDASRVGLALGLTRLGLNGAGLGLLVVYVVGMAPGRAWPLLGAVLGLLAVLVALPGISHSLARNRHEAMARVAAPAVLVVSFLLGPLTRLACALAPSLGAASSDPATTAPQSPAQGGSILIPLDEPLNPPDEQSMAMIQAILGMEQNTVRDVMVPRPDVVAIEESEPISMVGSLIVEQGHSRVLVYRDNIDQVVGILYARDLLRLMSPDAAPPTLRQLLRPPLFVPESKRLDELLREFQQERVQIAVVVDEYGGTAGLVTLEDLLEEIVGEIMDEFDRGEPEVQAISDEEVVLDARVNLDFLKEHFSVDVEGEGFDTVGGLVYTLLGRIPNPGDAVDADGLHIQVLSTLGRRIKKVRVVREPQRQASVNPQGVGGQDL